MHKKLTLLIAAGALGTAVAGCGTSKAPGITPAPSSGATAPTATASTGATGATGATGTTGSTSTTATVSTPTSGPLSKAPTVTKPSGAAPTKLVIKNVITGKGATAKAGDDVTVNYVLANYKTGKIIQSSFTSGQTFTANLSTTGSSTASGVIKGWVEGVPGEKVGGRRELIIPPSLAYGKTAQSGIPANSTLIFYIDLLKVSK